MARSVKPKNKAKPKSAPKQTSTITKFFIIMAIIATVGLIEYISREVETDGEMKSSDETPSKVTGIFKLFTSKATSDEEHETEAEMDNETIEVEDEVLLGKDKEMHQDTNESFEEKKKDKYPNVPPSIGTLSLQQNQYHGQEIEKSNHSFNKQKFLLGCVMVIVVISTIRNMIISVFYS